VLVDGTVSDGFLPVFRGVLGGRNVQFFCKKTGQKSQNRPSPDDMKQSSKGPPNFYQVAKLVRARIKAGGEQLWRVEDFSDLPFAAVARALSRLKKEGVIGRLTKGTYYLARTGVFGDFQPNPRAARKLASRHKSLFPAGMAAANLLGFTTQTAKRGE
jgi:hypothetical protein